MSSPPEFPLLNADTPYCCRIRDNEQTGLEDQTLFDCTGFSLNNKKRPADELLDMNAVDNKRRVAAKSVGPSRSQENLLPLEDAEEQDEDSRMLDTPDEEDDNNLPNQLHLRESLAQMPPPQAAALHIDATNTNELPLPSPSASPKQSSALDEIQEVIGLATHDPHSTVNAIEKYASSTLSGTALNHLVFRLIRKTDRKSLSDILNAISGSLKRDLLTNFPLEISQEVIKNLDYKTLSNILLVSKRWNKLVTPDTWRHMLLKDEFITPEELETLKMKATQDPQIYQETYIKRQRLFRNWCDPNFEPRKITVQGHGANVVTCLQFDDEKIITGADDKMINIYNPDTGERVQVLEGHEGGVWALKYVGNQIVSGSTDRTVRVWNIKTAKCTHVFRGHTSTIRCMEIVTTEDGQRLIITGSRDNSLHVWRLPDESDHGENYDEHDEENPYLVTVLRGHTASVRAVTGYGNIVVSGSYDHTVRVWDLKEKRTLFVLRGHTDRIYSTILDTKRNRCISASMDSTIKVWDLNTGECIADLTKHTSLVGLLGLSPKFLVSAAADGTLRGWDPENYDSKFVLHQENHAAITTFHATPNFLVSGSEGQFNVYDLRNNGKLIRSNLLPDAGPIWSAKFNDSKCVVAVEKNTHSFIEILDFSKRA